MDIEHLKYYYKIKYRHIDFYKVTFIQLDLAYL